MNTLKTISVVYTEQGGTFYKVYLNGNQETIKELPQAEVFLSELLEKEVKLPYGYNVPWLEKLSDLFSVIGITFDYGDYMDIS